MAVSETKRIGIKKYQQEKCDRITADIPKGKRDAYKRIAAELNLSLSQLIQTSVESYAGEDFHNQPAPMSNQPQQKISELDKQLLNLPTEQKKALLKFLDSLKQQDNSKGGGDND